MVLDKQPEPVRAALTLALVFGLRREEICGLRWTDIDFTNNVLHIRNTVTEFAGTVYKVEHTKTRASSRDLYMIPSTAKYLRELKAKQEKSGIVLDKVCVWPDGRVFKPTYITRASMRFLKDCGFEGVRLHDLRHTVASILAKRVPIKNRCKSIWVMKIYRQRFPFTPMYLKRTRLQHQMPWRVFFNLVLTLVLKSQRKQKTT